MITNLSKNYREHEIKLLREFDKIQISLDSHNEEMMINIRKAVRPSKIFNQIERVRKSAINQVVKPSKISFSVGVYNPSVWDMEECMSKLIELNTHSVTFWNLVDYNHNKTVKSIFSLPSEKFEEAKETTQNAFRVLRKAGSYYEIAGDFFEDITDKNYLRIEINFPRLLKTIFQSKIMNAIIGIRCTGTLQMKSSVNCLSVSYLSVDIKRNSYINMKNEIGGYSSTRYQEVFSKDKSLLSHPRVGSRFIDKKRDCTSAQKTLCFINRIN